jgi:hypothetical protein
MENDPKQSTKPRIAGRPEKYARKLCEKCNVEIAQCKRSKHLKLVSHLQNKTETE